jgi:hypothetical protein
MYMTMKKLFFAVLALSLSVLTASAIDSYRMTYRNGQPVLVSSADQALVLAEFDQEVSLTSMPDEVRSFLQTYVGMDAEDESALVALQQADNDSVGPLLGGILFDQGAPYNNLCPVLNGARSVTGCVATAMAEVMRYWQFPAVGTGTATYTSSKGATQYEFGKHPFDWNNMLETYTFSKMGKANFNDDQAAAVANLMLACGAAVNMNYDFAGSGSYISNAYIAMRDYFGYSPDIKYYESDSPNWDDWAETLQDQFDRKLPVLYAGTGTSGGHAFVLDGYKFERLESGTVRTRFHVNWGWNGAYNGWFLLRKLQPADDQENYSNINQRMVVNIYPTYPQGIEEVENQEPKAKSQKLLRDGQLLILRDGKTYNVLGMME